MKAVEGEGFFFEGKPSNRHLVRGGVADGTPTFVVNLRGGGTFSNASGHRPGVQSLCARFLPEAAPWGHPKDVGRQGVRGGSLPFRKAVHGRERAPHSEVAPLPCPQNRQLNV